VMAEVEAAVDPDAGLVDVDVVLRANGPLPLGGDPFALCSLVRRGCGGRRAVVRTFALCLRIMAGSGCGVLRDGRRAARRGFRMCATPLGSSQVQDEGLPVRAEVGSGRARAPGA
jgi:hypothetical protein